MAELGYTYTRFKNLDGFVGERNWNSRDAEKTDRYGKKYSWIAFFELYAVQQDRGLLSAWCGSRPSESDIDPSFPGTRQSTWRVPLDDVFSGTPSEPSAWLLCGRRPDFGRLVQRDTVAGKRGQWVLLDGYVEQVAPRDPRRVFSLLRGFLVTPNRADKFIRDSLETDYVGTQRLPDVIDDHDTFGGEIPWSSHFAAGLRTRGGGFRRQIESAFQRWNGKRRYGGTPVEVPAYDCNCKGDPPSEMLQIGLIPSPAICEFGGLTARGGSFDLFAPNGRQASLLVTWKDDRHSFTSRLLYIRKSLLTKYLSQTGQRLVMIVWGEREFTIASKLHKDESLGPLWQSLVHVHRHAHRIDL